MPHDALLWNAPPPPRCKPGPAERVWTMVKSGRRFEYELHGRGEYGWECQFLEQGDLTFARRFDLRAQALEWAELERQDRERDGWRLIP